MYVVTWIDRPTPFINVLQSVACPQLATALSLYTALRVAMRASVPTELRPTNVRLWRKNVLLFNQAWDEHKEGVFDAECYEQDTNAVVNAVERMEAHRASTAALYN